MVVAVELDTVAGVIDHRHVRIARPAGKLTQHAPHLAGAEIKPDVHGVEAGLLEHAADQRGIVHGIAELGRALVGGIADDERDPPVGMCRSASEAHRKYQQSK